MGKCDFKLQANIDSNCENPSVKGVRNTGYIINYDDIDWDASQRDTENPNIVPTLVLKKGAKKAYSVYIPGNTPFTGTQKALATGTYRNKFTKTLHLVVLDNGAGVAHDVIDQLANGRFVVILENKFTGKNGDNVFELYGFETGLAATEMTDEKYSEDTDGGWAVTLEETDAPTSGIFLFNESVETTRAAVESLLTATTPGV